MEFAQNKIATMGNCVLVLLLQTGVVTFCDNQGSEDNADQDREGFYIILRAKHCTLLENHGAAATGGELGTARNQRG